MCGNIKNRHIEEICSGLNKLQEQKDKMLNNNTIIGYKVGKTWRIPKANLIAYIVSKQV